MEDSVRSEPGEEARGFWLYASYIEEQLQNQEARKKSVEDRGSSVITTSGALATIILGFASFASESGSLEFTDSSRRAILLALIFFVLAALLALATNFPLPYKKPLEKDLRELLETGWKDTDAVASKEIADNRLDLLTHAGWLNSVKAWCLLGAMTSEVVAVAAVAVATWIIL